MTKTLTDVVINYSWWCQLLSTMGHGECGGCDCLCHERGSYGGVRGGAPRRPHSFPREDWKRGKRPKAWKEKEAARRREDRLLGLV